MDVIRDTLESIEGLITDKAGINRQTDQIHRSRRTGTKGEEERLYNRRKALENRRNSIKEYLETQLISAGIDKVKGTLFTISIQNNPLSVNIQDDATMPEKYYIPQPPKLDKRALIEDLKVRGAVRRD